MTDIRVIARFAAKAKNAEEVREILTGFVGPTRAENGCITYELLQNSYDPTDFTFVEEWETEEDLRIHSESSHLAEGRVKLEGKLEHPADVRKYLLIK